MKLGCVTGGILKEPKYSNHILHHTSTRDKPSLMPIGDLLESGRMVLNKNRKESPSYVNIPQQDGTENQ